MENDAAIQNAFGDTTARWVRDAVNALHRRPEQVVADLTRTLRRACRKAGQPTRRAARPEFSSKA